MIVALAEGATATDDRERSREATSLVASTARAALGEMRMLGVLRDESAADVPLSPVDEDTIPAAVEAARAAGAPVRLAVKGEPTGSRPVRLALARVVQEGLTNVLRHAPRARSVEVDLVYAGDGVELSIENDVFRGIRRFGSPRLWAPRHPRARRPRGRELPRRQRPARLVAPRRADSPGTEGGCRHELMEIRVLLVDDQQLIRLGFRMVLEAVPGIAVVGEAADGEAALEQAAALRPDVVLMDVRCPVPTA